MGTLANVVASRELLWNLTLRELRTKYRRSFLGWSWSLLNPLTTVALYGFVFGVLFNAVAPVGENSGLTGFAYFLLCAILPWNFFSMIVNTSMGAIAGNPGLVRRVAFQREVLVFANVGHAVVQFLIELVLLLVVLLVAGSPVLPYIPVVLGLTLLLALFGAGIGLVLSALAVYFKDLTYLWGIVMQVWFFLTPIVYAPQVLEDSLPNWVLNVLSANAMQHFVAGYRDALYHAQLPDLANVGMMLFAGTATFVAGWMAFTRLGRRLPEEV
jgi:ABC-type polysaccharide/polyol phosphate export permease